MLYHMNVWQTAILRSVKSLGGEAELQQIYKKLSDFINFNEKNKRESRYGRHPAYWDDVRSHIKDLCQIDELDWISESCYSLTEKGIKREDSEKGKKDLHGRLK